MSCSRRMEGSGFVKSENPELEVQNNCALAALMAAREAQDIHFHGAWTDVSSEETELKTLPPPITTIPPSDTCFQVDGHFYKIPDPVRAKAIESSLEELAAKRAKEEAKWAAHWIDLPILEISEIS